MRTQGERPQERPAPPTTLNPGLPGLLRKKRLQATSPAGCCDGGLGTLTHLPTHSVAKNEEDALTVTKVRNKRKQLPSGMCANILKSNSGTFRQKAGRSERPGGPGGPGRPGAGGSSDTHGVSVPARPGAPRKASPSGDPAHRNGGRQTCVRAPVPVFLVFLT